MRELLIEENKNPSLLGQIKGMGIGKIKGPIEKSAYIRSLISGNIKYLFPDREYRTGIDPEDSRSMIIERIK